MISIYMAGKIKKNCWRHQLVPGLRNHTYSDGPIKCSGFTYVGPFFTVCDHGCFHGENTHGVFGSLICEGAQLSRTQVIHRSHRCIAASDLVICYINSPDCYGTIAEIQYAVSEKKEVIAAFAPGIASSQSNDFWFVSEQCHKTVFHVDETQLGALLKSVLGA